MRTSTSTVTIGAGLVLLAAAVLGLGIGSVVATAEPDVSGATPGVLSGVDLRQHTTTLIDGVPGSRGSVEVRCPEGIVIGGGFSHVSSGLRVTASRPDGIHAWSVSWTQTSTDDTALYAYAVCLSTT